MKLIIAAGLIRSGSTWQYNCLRLGLDEAGVSYMCGRIEEYHQVASSASDDLYFLMKLHAFFPVMADNADAIFTSFRTNQEVLQSWYRLSGHRRESAFSVQHFEHLARWLIYGFKAGTLAYAQEFPRLKSDTPAVCRETIEALRRMFPELPEIDPGRVMARMQKLRRPKKGEPSPDPVTLMQFHRGKP